SHPSVGNTQTTTTDSSGYFSISGLKTNVPITFSTSATGYDDRSVQYTSVPQMPTWGVDLFLYPTTPPTTGASLYGQVYASGSLQGINGATVTISNGANSDSTTTSSSGYYEFSGLSEGQYTVTASASGHENLSESVEVGSTPTQHNIALAGHYALKVTVKDATSASIITDKTVTVSLTDGQETTTTTGVANFSVKYGSFTVTTAADGYSPTSQYVFVDRDASAIIFMGNTSSTNPDTQRQSYVPRQVRFTFLSSQTGSPIPGLSVSALGTNTTVGSWEWFLSIFGMDVSTAENVSTTPMSGTTGSDGSVVFMMVDSVYYKLNITNPDLGIAMLTNLYPREDEYVFTIMPNLPDATSRVSWDFADTAIDETHTKLGISYHDQGNRTKSFRFTVCDENHTLLHSETIKDDPKIDVSYTMENNPGAVVIWGFNATLNSTSGENEYVHETQFIRFEKDGAFDFGLPDVVRHWLGFFFLVCIGAMFGSMSLKYAGPTVGIFALFLKFIDWLPINWELAIIVFILGCLGYVRFTKDEKGV
ncbi:MAG: carboxypeptidase-like regulatory domain-containing protein, partial [Bacteroidales bacterium]|nr:carboxypeptidase-like regulatory domain-containing protein [Bacteroidales bacterium]